MLQSVQASPPPPTPECDSSAEAAPPLKKKKSWLSKNLGTPEESSATPLSPSELISTYLHLPKVGVECSPLEWWKAQEKQPPLLSRQACRYVCVCATSAPSERGLVLVGTLSRTLGTH